jgi:hypothetical protein
MFPIVSLKTVTSLAGMRSSAFSGDSDLRRDGRGTDEKRRAGSGKQSFMLRVSAVHACLKRVSIRYAGKPWKTWHN